MPIHIIKEQVGCNNTRCNHVHEHYFESECKGNCPEHGPFPTKWQASGAGPWIRWDRENGYRLQVDWTRYIGPWQAQTKEMFYPMPAEPPL